MEKPQLHISQTSHWNKFIEFFFCSASWPKHRGIELPLGDSPALVILSTLSQAQISHWDLDSLCCNCKNVKGQCVMVFLCVSVKEREGKRGRERERVGASVLVASLTNGSSFWKAVNCNRHQTPRAGKKRGQLSYIHSLCHWELSELQVLHFHPTLTVSASTVRNNKQNYSAAVDTRRSTGRCQENKKIKNKKINYANKLYDYIIWPWVFEVPTKRLEKNCYKSSISDTLHIQHSWPVVFFGQLIKKNTNSDIFHTDLHQTVPIWPFE